MADQAPPISALPEKTRKSGALSLAFSAGWMVTLELIDKVVIVPAKAPSCLVKFPMMVMVVFLSLFKDRTMRSR